MSPEVCHLDRARAGDPEAGKRADVLTPLVKAWGTDVGCEVASLGVQVHGDPGKVSSLHGKRDREGDVRHVDRLQKSAAVPRNRAHGQRRTLRRPGLVRSGGIGQPGRADPRQPRQ